MTSQSVGAQAVEVPADEFGAAYGDFRVSVQMGASAVVTVQDSEGKAVKARVSFEPGDKLSLYSTGDASADVMATAPGLATLTATPVEPDAPVETATLKVYPAFTLTDRPDEHPSLASAVRIAGEVTTKDVADVWLESPNFPDGHAQQGDSYRLHVPGGVLAIDEAKMGAPLDLTALDWNAAPAVIELGSEAIRGSAPVTRWVGRDRAGQLFKLRVATYSGQYQTDQSGAIIPGSAAFEPLLWVMPANTVGEFDY
ncbi:hypothetical protein [Deinococcus peraridilitoris]|nr:hypothetical protein [Deinococcus peraridilitoris]